MVRRSMARPLRETTQSFRAAAKRINKAARELSSVTRRGPRMIGEEIMADVKNSRPGRGVPLDTGALRSTGRVEGGTSAAPAALQRVELSFGGPAAPYALIQHERLDYHHTVGEPRYLVRGLERWRPGSSMAMHQMSRNAQAALVKAGRGAGRTP